MGLDLLRGRRPGFGKGLGLLLKGQVGVLARLTLVLGEAEEGRQGTLGGVGVLERGQTLATRVSQGLAARVLGVVLCGGQLLETVAGRLLEDGVVGLVLVLVDLLRFKEKTTELFFSPCNNKLDKRHDLRTIR